MSITADEEPKHEIIIVKRHGDHEEGHHGGVWKIAFADFMTAMMCFFLVMWLINASNEQTQAAVASYFNPVKLIDRNSSKKGLEDIGDGAHSAGATSADAVSEQVKPTEGVLTADPSTRKDNAASESKNHSDKHLFANPYAFLSEIAEETGDLPPGDETPERKGRRRRADVRSLERRFRRRSLSRSLRPRFLDAAGRVRTRNRAGSCPQAGGGRRARRRFPR